MSFLERCFDFTNRPVKSWFNVALTALVIFFTALFIVNIDNASSIKTSAESVFRIDEQCSAVVIDTKFNDDKTYLLTAKHCVNDVKTGFIDQEVSINGELQRYNRYVYDVEKSSYKYDLALLSVRDRSSKLPMSTLAEERIVNEGDEVYVIGYPLGWIRTITRGVFNEYQNIDPNNHKKNNDVYYRATASVNFGSSGGGLFQLVGEGYELIGITSMKVRGTDFMNLFVPLENIRDFLRLEKRAKEIRDSLKINLEEFPGERF